MAMLGRKKWKGAEKAMEIGSGGAKVTKGAKVSKLEQGAYKSSARTWAKLVMPWKEGMERVE